MSSVQWRPNGKARARYRDADGKEHARHFDTKKEARRWLKEVGAAEVTGTYVDPATARMTVGEWCDRWIEGYSTRRPSTVRQARVHLKVIKAELGTMRLADVRPSHVKAFTATLGEKYAESTRYAIYRRLVQVMGDAVHDGIIPRSPCSRRTSPGQSRKRPLVPSTEAVWALYDAFPAHLKAAVLLGAFAGLRTSEAAGLRTSDVDFDAGVISPEVQHRGAKLKTTMSATPIPIPVELAMMLQEHAGVSHIVTSEIGRETAPWVIERAVREHRGEAGLPEEFRFHDLRHFYASTLIAAGLDVKVVQARVRHSSATTTLDVYGHLFPDADESARAAIGTVLAARADSLRTDAR